MAYSRDSIGELPKEEYAKFLCPRLLRRKFNFPVGSSRKNNITRTSAQKVLNAISEHCIPLA
jgi:hypothetical protein